MSIHEKFESILANNAFDQLRPYSEPLSWNGMSDDEKALLGLLFVRQGEQLLKIDDQKAMESFELAAKVAPANAQIFFRQAFAYASQSQNIRSLNAADQALNRATALDPAFIHAWSLWGNVLCKIGFFYNDVSYMYQGLEKYAAAEKLSIQFDSQQLETVYWHSGLCFYQIGKLSGEAVDFIGSLEKFRAASLAGCDEGLFYCDYANLLMDLACLINRIELLHEAVDIYSKAAKRLPDKQEVWTNLGCTYKRLYESRHSKEDFLQADACFTTAVKLNPDHAMSWFHWGGLYLNAGKYQHDPERLKISIEKFERANFNEGNVPQILLAWGEAQMLVASYEEQLEHLREAEGKIITALNSLPDHPEAWYIYGLCLEAYGRYFGLDSYYLQAIEKYEHALSLSGSCVPAIRSVLLNGLALIYFDRGDLLSSLPLIEKSIEYFKEAAAATSLPTPQLLNDWGIAYLKMGELNGEKTCIEEAIQRFEEAISKGFELNQGEMIELEWLYNYGCSLDFLGDYQEDASYYERAIQVLSHILKVDPDYSDATYNLALTYAHLAELNSDIESYHQAIDLFQKLTEEDSEDDVVWNDYGYALLNLGMLLDDPVGCEEAKEIFSHAEKKLQQAIALGNLNAYYNMSCLYACTNNISAAISSLERAEINDVLPPVEDLLNDEWLDSLRNHPTYRAIISRLFNKNVQ